MNTEIIVNTNDSQITNSNNTSVNIPRQINMFPWPVPVGWERVWYTPQVCNLLGNIFTRLKILSDNGMIIYPYINEVFRAFDLCPLDKVIVVIIGQDPYHNYDNKINRPCANGLAFSGNKNGKNPRSLSNVFKELKRTHPHVVINHCDLTSWAQQGILLINTSLTVEANNPKTHVNMKLWDEFFLLILKAICYFKPEALFCLWGDVAIKYSTGINPPITSKNIIESGHPSPINRSVDKQFIGNNHFLQIDNYINYQNSLRQHYNSLNSSENRVDLIPQIDWNLH